MKNASIIPDFDKLSGKVVYVKLCVCGWVGVFVGGCGSAWVGVCVCLCVCVGVVGVLANVV